MNYILITYDAVAACASDRYLQSAEYNQAESLANLLSGKTDTLESNSLMCDKIANRGIIIHTKKVDKEKGLLFDLRSFQGFQKATKSEIINIFQKTIKYTIKHYNKYPTTSYEKIINEDLTLIFALPFVEQAEVTKIYIDKTHFCKNRKPFAFLTAYYFGHNENAKVKEKTPIEVIEDLRDTQLSNETNTETRGIDCLQVTTLQNNNQHQIDDCIGFEKWKCFLTDKQKKVIFDEPTGIERLEGAAGSGKTVTMILKSINLLLTYNPQNDLHIIFITHSIASKEKAQNVFSSNCPNYISYLETQSNRPKRSILFTTLLEWCNINLGTNSIEESEFLDKDATTSKQMQSLYIQEALNKIKEESWTGYSQICSNEMKTFIEEQAIETVIELFRYEISVLIKGKANGVLDKYKKIDRPTLSLPIKNEADFYFSFDVFNAYQKSLESTGLFDSDDITLSALGQLITPIWQRRNTTNGYDICFIDETQLFNFNEISLFHYINKPDSFANIIYSIDKTQFFGEIGFTEDDLNELWHSKIQNHTKLETLFRSSTAVINLAFNILSSNSAIFHNFENPLDKCSYSFTVEEENKCEDPTYFLCNGDDSMIDVAIKQAERYHLDKNVDRGKILLVSTQPDLLVQIQKKCNNAIVFSSKNDIKSKSNPLCNNYFVLSPIELVGGLEFDAVFIVGVDKNRVPPQSSNTVPFVQFAWGNHMYLATTRAKYNVQLFGNKNYGISPLLESSLYRKCIKLEELH